MYESVYIHFHIYVNLKLRSRGKMNLHVYFLLLNDTEKSPKHNKDVYKS